MDGVPSHHVSVKVRSRLEIAAQWVEGFDAKFGAFPKPLDDGRGELGLAEEAADLLFVDPFPKQDEPLGPRFSFRIDGDRVHGT